MYVDGHLDLAINVVAHGRDLTRTMQAIRREEQRSSMEVLVTFPELRRGGVGIVVGTLYTVPRDFVRPAGAPPLTARQRGLTYETPEEAERLALEQLAIYERWEAQGWVRILRTRADLEGHVRGWEAGGRTVGLIVSMEGADPIRTPDDLPVWIDRGLRLIGPAWQRTRYCGGTHAPGPLTPLGRELVLAMKEEEVPLDVSHLAEESFWDALDLGAEVVFASHSNARAVAPGDRHLSDPMIEEIGDRDGLVGLALGNELVKAGVRRGDPKSSVTLDDVRAHAEHVAGLIGWNRVGIGSD
ncbi:MAG: membrane dipeptidase, partial [Rhodothermales bacterium]|nr:membrane dipeptidase [Rhodothermales bacterium]